MIYMFFILAGAVAVSLAEQFTGGVTFVERAVNITKSTEEKLRREIHRADSKAANLRGKLQAFRKG